MSYPTSELKYPVVDRDPTFRKIMSSFRTSDWRNLILATGVSLPFGYWAGRPVLMRPSMYMAGTIGATFGLFLGFQSSFGRLVGLKENDVEVAKYAKENAAKSTT